MCKKDFKQHARLYTQDESTEQWAIQGMIIFLEDLTIDGEPGNYSPWPILVHIWLNTDDSNNNISPQLSRYAIFI